MRVVTSDLHGLGKDTVLSGRFIHHQSEDFDAAAASGPRARSGCGLERRGSCRIPRSPENRVAAIQSRVVRSPSRGTITPPTPSTSSSCRPRPFCEKSTSARKSTGRPSRRAAMSGDSGAANRHGEMAAMFSGRHRPAKSREQDRPDRCRRRAFGIEAGDHAVSPRRPPSRALFKARIRPAQTKVLPISVPVPAMKMPLMTLQRSLPRSRPREAGDVGVGVGGGEGQPQP